MKQNEELIKKIELAIISEEDAIIIYSQHLKTILAWSGLAVKEQSLIREYLDILHNESAEHKRLLSSLKNELEQEI